MTKWFEEDLFFVSPLLVLLGLIAFFHYADRRVKSRQVDYKVSFFENGADLCIRPGHKCATPGAGPCNGLPRPQPTIKKLAVDWGTDLTALLNELTRAGFVVLLNEDRDEFLIAPGRSAPDSQAHIHAKPDGTGWELRS